MKVLLMNLFLILMFIGSPLTAQEIREEVVVERNISVTCSPIHLLSDLKIAELTVEFNLTSELSVAAIGAYGKPELDGYDATAFEYGGQVRYYINPESKHKIHAGVEALWIDVEVSDDARVAAATGLQVSPFIGYKYISDMGFTFDGQVGYGRVMVEGEDTTASKNQLMLNLNIGWSF